MRRWLAGHWLTSETSRSLFAVGSAFAVVVLMIGLGWAMLTPDGGPEEVSFRPPQTSSDSTSSTPTPSPTASPSASPSATPTATTTPSRTRAPVRQTTPAPRPTAKPPKDELPPPPPPPAPTTGPNCPTFKGEQAPYADVRAALAEAGGINYWGRSGVTPPQGAANPVPPITVPASLMNAIAMTESTWRSNVIACDGGIGTMQIMPDTATWMNSRFNANFDVYSLSGNTRLGAAYIEWLIVYFGIFYFGEQYNLETTAPVGPGGATVKLADVVIAAYNVGPYAVENLHGTPTDPSDDTLEIPNQWYVDRVNGYWANCPCDSF